MHRRRTMCRPLHSQIAKRRHPTSTAALLAAKPAGRPPPHERRARQHQAIRGGGGTSTGSETAVTDGRFGTTAGSPPNSWIDTAPNAFGKASPQCWHVNVHDAHQSLRNKCRRGLATTTKLPSFRHSSGSFCQLHSSSTLLFGRLSKFTLSLDDCFRVHPKQIPPNNFFRH